MDMDHKVSFVTLLSDVLQVIQGSAWRRHGLKLLPLLLFAMWAKAMYAERFSPHFFHYTFAPQLGQNFITGLSSVPQELHLCKSPAPQ